MNALAHRRFLRMNGLGNEITVLDLRGTKTVVTAGEARAIATSAALARTEWFDSRRLATLGEEHISGRADHSRLLWQLLMLDKSLVRMGIA